MILARGQYTIKRVANKRNLLNWQETWKEGSLPVGWSLNGAVSENSVVLGSNPFGAKSLLWKCTPDNVTPQGVYQGGAAGGYRPPKCSLDNIHTYRCTVFVYREKASKGYIYLGAIGVNNLSGGTNDNYHFVNGGYGAGEWYLLVGHIHPSKADNTWQMATSGRYDMSGRKIDSGTDYKLKNPTEPVTLRNEHHYTDNPEDVAYFYNPRLEVCDGNEPSIEQLLQVNVKDVENKVDTMKTTYDTEFLKTKELISLKANSDTVSALGSRLSSAEAKITADAINLTVKSQVTKASQDAQAYADSKVDNLQIGGRNILKDSGKELSVPRDYSHFVHTPIFKDNEYTYSVWLKANRTTNVDVYVNDDRGTNKAYILFGVIKITTEYTKYTLTAKARFGDGETLEGILMRVYGMPGDIITGKEAKLELGNKATDWSPAPEDTTADAAAKADAARIAAEAVAVAKANLAKTESQAYADGIVTAEEQRAIADAQAKLDEAKADAALRYTTKTEYSAQIQILNNEISQRVTKSIFDTAISDAQLLAKAMSRGLMLYDDPTFKKGFNSVNAYINNGGGNVSITREKTDDAPNDSGYCLKINVFDGANLPLGGFYFGTKAKANKVMVCRFVAKVPENQSLVFTSNSYGTGGVVTKWLTSNKGTGKWEEYAYYVKCGETGTFSSTFFFYLNRLADQIYPVTWYLAYATVFDLNASEVYTPLSVSESNKIQLENLIASKVSQTNFDALGNRVGAAESNITQQAGLIASKVSQSTFDALGNRVTAAETSISQTPNKIALAVSGSEEKIKSSLTLDSSGISLLGKKIALTGAVTFSSLAPDAQGKVNTAQSTANSAASKADAAQGTANTANSGLSTLKSSLKGLAYQDKVSLAKLDETIVEGGYLKTNLIDANAIVTSSLIAEKIAATDITTGRLTVTDGAKIGNMSIVGGVLTGSSVNLTDGAVLGGLKATGSTGRGAYSSLTNEGFNNEAVVILRNDNNNIFCAIGTNVMPSASGVKAVARFENEYSTNFTNFGLLVSAKNGRSGNIAIGIDGGCVSGFKYRVQGLSGSGTIETGVGFVQMGNTNYDPNVYLPSNPELGTIIYTCNANRAINVYGNGRQIKQGPDIRNYVNVTSTNQVAMFVYTGVYWIYNWLNR